MDPAHNYGYRGKTKIGLEGNVEPIALLQFNIAIYDVWLDPRQNGIRPNENR
jgi:hypothetical protein